jgi:hypothetical protein
LYRQPSCWRSDRRWCGRPRDFENRARRRDQSPRAEQKVSGRSGRSVSTNQIDPPARGLVVAKTTSGNRPPPHQRDVEFSRTGRRKKVSPVAKNRSEAAYVVETL